MLVAPSVTQRAISPAIEQPNPARVSPVDQRRSLVSRWQTLRGWLARSGGHGVWIALWSVVGWSGTALAPVLHDEPVALMLLAPRAVFVALAAPSVDLVVFVLLGTMRLAVTDASYFILGRRFRHVPRRASTAAATGPIRRVRQAVFGSVDRLCAWLGRHGIRAGAVLFLRPNGKYLAVAGAYGVSSPLAGFSSVIGTAVYLTAIHLGLSQVI